MILSTKGRYGLKAMVDIALNSQQTPVSIHSIALRQDISDRYLEQLIGRLKKAGLLKSSRGSQGGYQLSKDISEITVGEILSALEGNLKPINCKELDEEGGCKTAESCVTKYVWKRIYDNILDSVNHIYLSELVEQSKDLKPL